MKRKEFLNHWRSKSIEELRSEILSEENALMLARFKRKVDKTVNVNSCIIKKRIARLHTLINQNIARQDATK